MAGRPYNSIQDPWQWAGLTCRALLLQATEPRREFRARAATRQPWARAGSIPKV